MSVSGLEVEDMAPYVSALYNKCNHMLDCIGAPMRVLVTGIAASKTTTASTFAGMATQTAGTVLNNVYTAISETVASGYAGAYYVTASNGTTNVSLSWLASTSGKSWTTASRFQGHAQWDTLDAWLDLMQYVYYSTYTLTAQSRTDGRQNVSAQAPANWNATTYEAYWDDVKVITPITHTPTYAQWAQTVGYAGSGGGGDALFGAYIFKTARWSVPSQLDNMKGTVTQAYLTYTKAGLGTHTSNTGIQIDAGADTSTDTVYGGTTASIDLSLPNWDLDASQVIDFQITTTPPANTPFVYADPDSTPPYDQTWLEALRAYPTRVRTWYTIL